MTLSFPEARACILQSVKPSMGTEEVSLLDSDGRILAEPIHADRDYPPFPRSSRDGFAVKAENLPGELRVIGEVRAGESFPDMLVAGEAVEIMTGAPLPEGADAVVMVEHTVRNGSHVRIDHSPNHGDNFAPTGSEAVQGSVILSPASALASRKSARWLWLVASASRSIRKPRVAILPTGDELVEVQSEPEPFQIRNSNAWSLSVQVRRAGGEPEILPTARDNYESTRNAMEKGLEADLLLLSGGVSAGKYDIVERVLADLGAEFFFDRVKIQPGQPVVFGRVKNKFFFGLPGNPASTMVTFEIFARAALERMQRRNLDFPAPPTSEAHKGFPAQTWPDAIPSCLGERGRRKRGAGRMERLRRHSLHDEGQRVPGGRRGPGIMGQQVTTSACY